MELARGVGPLFFTRLIPSITLSLSWHHTHTARVRVASSFFPIGFQRRETERGRASCVRLGSLPVSKDHPFSFFLGCVCHGDLGARLWRHTNFPKIRYRSAFFGEKEKRKKRGLSLKERPLKTNKRRLHSSCILCAFVCFVDGWGWGEKTPSNSMGVSFALNGTHIGPHNGSQLK